MREDPTRPREPDPHSQPDREGFREGRGCDLGESGREKTQSDQRNQTSTLNGQRGVHRGERDVGGVGNEIRLGTSWRKTKMVSQ